LAEIPILENFELNSPAEGMSAMGSIAERQVSVKTEAKRKSLDSKPGPLSGMDEQGHSGLPYARMLERCVLDH
jgi:hypothetical protein